MPVVLFHSMFGLRPVEIAAAERLPSVGRHVVVQDLFAEATAPGARAPLHRRLCA